MTFSTSMGIKATLIGFGVSWISWISHVFAQVPVDPTASPPVPIPSQLPAVINWPTAVATVVTGLVTLGGIYKSTRKTEEELAQTRKSLRLTRRKLRRTERGLKTTRRNRHDERHKLSEIIGDLQGKLAEIAEGHNILKENQDRVMEQGRVAGEPAPRIDPWLPKERLEPPPNQTVFADPPADATGKKVYTAPKGQP